MWMVAVRLKPKNLGPTTQDSVTLYKWFSTRGTQFSKARAALSEDIFGLYNEGMGRGCCHAVRRLLNRSSNAQDSPKAKNYPAQCINSTKDEKSCPVLRSVS